MTTDEMKIEKVTALTAYLTNEDDANRAYDMQARVTYTSGNAFVNIEEGTVKPLNEDTDTSIASFSQWNNLNLQFFTSENRVELMHAVEEFNAAAIAKIREMAGVN